MVQKKKNAPQIEIFNRHLPPFLGNTVAISLLAMILAANVISHKPFYNWDLIGYVGVVNTWIYMDTDLTHQNTYREIRDHVPEYNVEVLVGENSFRLAMAENPVAFSQQLPFYSVKPLYPFLMIFVNKLGFDLVYSSLIVSYAAYILLGFLIFLYMRCYYGPMLSLCITAILISIPYTVGLAQYSTPDGLSTVLIFSFLYFYATTSRRNLGFFALMLSITARPDNFIFAFALLVLDFLFCRPRPLVSLGWLSGLVLIYFLQTKISGNYGWRVLFFHSFIDMLENPTSQNATVSLQQYLRVLWNFTASLQFIKVFSVIVACIGAILLHWRVRFQKPEYFTVLCAVLMFITAHWFIFPFQKGRLLWGMVLVVFVIWLTSSYRLPISRMGRWPSDSKENKDLS